MKRSGNNAHSPVVLARVALIPLVLFPLFPQQPASFALEWLQVPPATREFHVDVTLDLAAFPLQRLTEDTLRIRRSLVFGQQPQDLLIEELQALKEAHMHIGPDEASLVDF